MVLLFVAVLFPVQPAVALPCSGKLIFRANFNLDTLDAPPDTSLPGPPVGDSISLNIPAGYIKVRSAIGDLTNQPVEVRMTGGIGGVDLRGTVAGTPPTSGTWIATWRGLVQSGGGPSWFGPMVIRDSSSLIVAAVAFRGSGIIDFNDLYASSGIGVSYTTDVSQYFELTIDMDAKTTSLSIDGVPVAVAQNAPFYQSSASNIGQMNFEVGYTTAQAYALDDMKIVSADFSLAESLESVKNYIDDLDSDDFSNKNHQKTLINKIDAVINKIEAGDLDSLCEAIDKLNNDLLPKTDGETPPPDWVIDPTAQQELEDCILAIIQLLQDEVDALGGCP